MCYAHLTQSQPSPSGATFEVCALNGAGGKTADVAAHQSENTEVAAPVSGLDQFLARARLLMLVHERQHDDLVLFNHVEKRIREPAKHRPADLAFDSLVERWLSSQMRLCPFEILDEFSRLIDLGLRIPGNGSLNLGGRGALVADRIGHYDRPSFALTSASETVSSSGWAR